MKLLSTRLRGIGPFVDARVDLRALPDAALVVAVVGENGAGKSTLFESALLGATYRTLPTRGAGRLATLATTRESLVESEIEIGNGRTVRFTQHIDAHTGAGAAFIVDVATGETLISSTKVSEADAWVAAHLPAQDVVRASTFSAQQSKGIREMGAADRKRLVLRTYGIERTEALAARAREQVTTAKRALDTARTRRDEAARSVVEVPPEALAAAEAAEASATTECDVTGARLRWLREQLEAARERARALRAHDEALDRAKRDHATARGAVQAIETRIANNHALLADEARIREAHARLAEARETRAASKAALGVAQRENGEANAAASIARARVEGIQRRMHAAEEAAHAAEARLRRHAAAVAALPVLDAASLAVLRAEEAEAIASEALASLQTAHAGRSAKRIEGLREGLVTVTREEGDNALVAAQTLDADDTEAALAADYPEDHQRAEHAQREARAALARARTGHLAAVKATEGRDETAEPEHAAAVARLADMQGELAFLRDAAEARDDEARAARMTLEDAETAAHEAACAHGAADFALRALRCSDLASLDAARARLDTLSEQYDAAIVTRDIADAEEVRLAACPPPPSGVDAALVAVESAEAAHKRATGWLADMRGDLSAMRARAEDAARGRERLDVLERELAEAEREAARWSRLAADLGPSGLQAHLVDAAGPELSALTNELLHACVSTRWTVTIATTRTTGKGEERESCDILVLDGVTGREGPIESYSGGECVLLGEAVSLALTVAACRTAGMEGVSLVRDESGAALDADMSRAFVAMLRRAAGMVRASRVFLVTHAREVIAECDAAIKVADGTAEIVSVEEVV